MDELWMVYGVVCSEPCVMGFDTEGDAIAFMADALDGWVGGELTRLMCSTVKGVSLAGFDLVGRRKLGWVRGLVQE